MTHIELFTPQNLQLLRDYVQESNATNSNNDKLEVLRKNSNNDFLKKVLFYTYNPFYQYRISVSNLQKRQDLVASFNKFGDDFFALLDELRLDRITGHDAIMAVNAFVRDHVEYQTELYYIIDHNLQTRVTATSVNKIIDKLIPEFNVALCEDYDKQKKKPIFNPIVNKDVWYQSRKLDGCRAIASVDEEGNVTFYSRAGKEFKVLQKVIDEIKKLGFKNIILDGEICLIKEDGSDDFSGIMKEISRKDHVIQNPRYRVFDILTHQEFADQTSDTILSERLQRLDQYDLSNSEIVKKLEQTKIVSQAQFENIREHAAEEGWEGIIIRKDTFYEGKRSKNMLKVKQFQDAEYVVVDVEISNMRVTIANGVGGLIEVNENLLSAIKIVHKGNIVSVGSGFTIDERRKYKENPSLIIGKTVTVKYFEETLNKEGNYSLRFPIVKFAYENGREDTINDGKEFFEKE